MEVEDAGGDTVLGLFDKDPKEYWLSVHEGPHSSPHKSPEKTVTN